MYAPKIVIVLVILDVCRKSSAWVLLKGSLCHPKIRGSGSLLTVNSIFYEDQYECSEEDECDINWDKMPEFNDEYKGNFEHDGIPVEELPNDDLEPKSPHVRGVERTIKKSRMIFEMNWQIENCVVDADSCEDFCSECAGSGKTWCKFCRGTRVISFGKEFKPCLICTDGKVNCSTCSGTGHISPWAATHDKTL